MSIHLEMRFAVIRGGKNYEYGKEYDFVASCFFSDATVEIFAMHGDVAFEDLKEIKTYFKNMGFKKIIYDRLKRSKRRIEIDL